MLNFDLSKYFNFQGAIALIAALGLMVGSVLGVHAYFAKEREFKAYVASTEQRLAEADIKLLIHQAEQSKSYVQEKIWKVQDRIEQKPKDAVAKQQLRELEDEKVKLDIRVQDLKSGKK